MNQQPHVVMLLANAYKPDLRPRREAEGLLAAGYRVTIICWDRLAEFPATEDDAGIAIIRVKDVVSGYGKGWRQLFYLPRFWRRARAIAQELRPDFIHAHDLDTLYLGVQLKRQLGCPLIYDAHEHYPALMSLYLPAPFVTLLEQMERRLIKQADATLTASTILRDEYRAAGVSPVETLGNYPDAERFQPIDPAVIHQTRQELGVAPEQLLVAYIAGFSRNRMIVPFVEAAGLLPGVAFHIWGGGLQEAEIKAAVDQFPNAHFHGWCEPDELPRFFQTSDVVYYGLRLDYPGAIYNAPNTMTQAMMSQRPIIATDVGDLGRIVDQTGAGVLIASATAQAIAEAVDQLRDPALRAEMGACGAKATGETLNAAENQRRLIMLYQALSES